MAVPVERFIRDLEASGLMTPDAIREFQASLRPEVVSANDVGCDPNIRARWFVEYF